MNNKTTERRHWRCCGVFIANFEHISHLAHTVFLLIALSREMPAGNIHLWLVQNAGKRKIKTSMSTRDVK